jgi:hypothetical protein
MSLKEMIEWMIVTLTDFIKNYYPADFQIVDGKIHPCQKQKKTRFVSELDVDCSWSLRLVNKKLKNMIDDWKPQIIQATCARKLYLVQS